MRKCAAPQKQLIWAFSLAVASVITFAFQKPVVVSFVPGFHTGREFLQVLNHEERRAYVRGVGDGIGISTYFAADIRLVQELNRCTAGMDDIQMTAIVEKFIRDRPAIWHRPANDLYFAAFGETCKFNWVAKNLMEPKN